MDHTIAAIATAPGEGGIGIIRISGCDSLDILKRIFRYKSGKAPAEFEPRRMVYGNIHDIFEQEYVPAGACVSTVSSSSEIVNDGTVSTASEVTGGAEPAETERAEAGAVCGRVIDECMAVYMKAPHTYTGEDVVEIQCHGSIISVKKILQLVLKCGASLAERGEFTKRAFLNGRMDLSQAEAVIDVIKARSETGFDTAVSQMQGGLSVKIKKIRKEMADLISDIVAHIEYPEEDLEELTYGKITDQLSVIKADIQKLADSADTGRVLRDGLKVTIAGRPNVGKSSLMNAILREERAIVTDIPGTTRDTIEEMASIGGIPVRIADTAGIRETDNIIEKIGIEKSRESIESSDVVIMMIDGSNELSDSDREILNAAAARKCIIILNKSDLGCIVDEEVLAEAAGICADEIIHMSAANGEGIDELRDRIRMIVYNGEVKPGNDIMITNVRHEELLRQALQLLEDAEFMLISGEALDFAESDIREAWMAMGEITGEAVTDDIVKEVFARFCLGK